MKAFDSLRKREYFGFGEPCNIPEEHKQVSIKGAEIQHKPHKIVTCRICEG